MNMIGQKEVLTNSISQGNSSKALIFSNVYDSAPLVCIVETSDAIKVDNITTLGCTVYSIDSKAGDNVSPASGNITFKLAVM